MSETIARAREELQRFTRRADERLRELGVKIIRAPVAAESGVVRHDSERLSRALLRLVR